MTLYVQFNGHTPLGIVLRTAPGGPKVGSLNEYLKSGGSSHILYRSSSAPDLLYWNNQTIRSDSQMARVLYRVLDGIKRNQKVPNTLDSDTLRELDTPDMVAFEEALYDHISTSRSHWMADQI